MKLTKYGHCCLLIEIKGKRVLTDPGAFSDGFKNITNLDLILITHEHADHLHTSSLQRLLSLNPQAKVITNAGVGKILDELGIDYTELPDREEATVSDLKLKPYDGKHAEIVRDFGQVQNTGFVLEGGEFMYPGDSYIVPDEKINLLAAPVAGPWCKVSEAIAYVLEVGPKQVIPVHDAVLSEAGKHVTYPHFERELGEKKIHFIPIDDQNPTEIK